jgi:hypothetical protein
MDTIHSFENDTDIEKEYVACNNLLFFLVLADGYGTSEHRPRLSFNGLAGK